MQKKIRVLVVDDHTVVRDGISALLALAGDMEVIGEANNGNEAIELIKKLMPNVVLMDIAMPVMGGLEATRRILKDFPGTKILVLTQYDDKEYFLPVIESGASGFISKAAASSELVTGIRSIYRGDSFLSPSVTKLLIEAYQRSITDKNSHDPYNELTQRERDIFKLLVEGYTTQEIAYSLSISPKTVEGHKTKLMNKLGVHNRFELIKYALRKGVNHI
ncbi:MAG: response regulator transcription factor [Dehalococcoidales bacterium]|nr:response regulator transcription factor [Dehalococcoidales bacterium]